MATLKKKTSRTVLKRSSAVVVSGKLSKKAKIVYNILLDRTRRAIKFDPSKTEFSVSVNEVLSRAKIDNDSYSYAKNILKSVQKAYLEKDTLNIDGSGEWFMENLITSAGIKDGQMMWSMSPKMLRLIRDTKNPEDHIHPYIIVDLGLQTNFDKHGLTLYELGLHWLPTKALSGDSGWLELEKVRELFGVKYPSYGKLNQDVFQKALKSVNEEKNGSPFTVTIGTRKIRNAIKYVNFHIERRKIFADGIIDVETQEVDLVGKMMDGGLHLKTAENLYLQMEERGNLSYFATKIDAIIERYKNKLGVEKTKLVTGAINNELQQMPLPFGATEKATPTPFSKDDQLIMSANKCYADKGADCEVRKVGYSPNSMCNVCFGLYKLPELS